MVGGRLVENCWVAAGAAWGKSGACGEGKPERVKVVDTITSSHSRMYYQYTVLDPVAGMTL